MQMGENTFTDFVRNVFASDELVKVKEIYEMVLANKALFSSFPSDYQHRVRSALYHLKKNGEIISIRKGTYKRVLQNES